MFYLVDYVYALNRFGCISNQPRQWVMMTLVCRRDFEYNTKLKLLIFSKYQIYKLLTCHIEDRLYNKWLLQTQLSNSVIVEVTKMEMKSKSTSKLYRAFYVVTLHGAAITSVQCGGMGWY